LSQDTREAKRRSNNKKVERGSSVDTKKNTEQGKETQENAKTW